MDRIQKGYYQTTQRFHELLFSFYTKLGIRVATWPYTTIILAIFFAAIFSLGILFITEEVRGEKLYAPQQSIAFDEKHAWEDIFDSTPRGELLYFMSPEFGFVSDTKEIPTLSNFLTKERFKSALDLVKEIVATTIEHDGKTWTFQDLCVKTSDIPFSPCYIQSALLYWDFNYTLLENDTDIHFTIFNRTNAPISNLPVDWTTLFADPKVSGGKVVSAVGFKHYFVLSSENEEAAIKWEKKVLQTVLISNQPTTPETGAKDIYYTMDFEESINLELGRSVAGDVSRFVFGLVAMMLFLVFVMSDFRNPTTSHSIVGIAGVISASFGIASGFGIAGWIGIPYIAPVGVAPFLVLGIAVDDAFLIFAAMRQTYSDPHLLTKYGPGSPIAERVGGALSLVAESITLTTFTDIAAFACAAFSAFPAIQIFAYYSLLAIAMDFLFQITFYTAIVTLSFTRMERNLPEYLFLFSIGGPQNSFPRKLFCSDSSTCVPRIFERSNPISLQHLYSQVSTSTQIQSFVEKYYIPFLEIFWVRVVILVISFAFFGIALYGATQVEQGFDSRLLYPKDSYLQTFITIRDYYYFQGVYFQSIVKGDYPYHDQAKRDLYKELVSTIVNCEATNSLNYTNWLEVFTGYLAVDHVINIDSLNETSFYSYLFDQFLVDPRYQIFQQDVRVSSDKKILGTEFGYHLRKESLEKPLVQATMMDELRVCINTSSFAQAEIDSGKKETSAFPYSFFFIFFEQFKIILRETISNLIFALLAVAILATLFLGRFKIVFFLTLGLAMIDAGLFFAMYIADIAISAVSTINIVIAIGISIDFLSHTAAGYAHSTKTTRMEKVKESLSLYAGSIFLGAITTLLGILFVIGSQSNIFDVFLKMLVSIIVLAFWHGLFFLPAILSFVGPLETFTSTSEPQESFTESYELETFG